MAGIKTPQDEEEEIEDDNVPLVKLVQLMAAVKSKVTLNVEMNADKFVTVDCDTETCDNEVNENWEGGRTCETAHENCECVCGGGEIVKQHTESQEKADTESDEGSCEQPQFCYQVQPRRIEICRPIVNVLFE